MLDYQAPMWLPGGNLQTIWAALAAQRGLGAPPRYRRERWNAPDGDFIDLDFADFSPLPAAASARAGAPADAFAQGADPASHAPSQTTRTLLVLFHGLEGSSRSHYAEAFHDCAQRRGMSFVVPHFRGCGGEINRAPRAYHSGDYEEVDWILKRLAAGWRAQGGRQLIAVGVSLGGNALLRWAAEAGDDAAHAVGAVAAVCSPLDLAAGGHAVGRGLNRLLYTPMFLRTMKPRALAKLRQFPGLFDQQALLRARTLYEFDDVFTAPLHGFKDALDYWTRASAKPQLHRVRIPALAVNALNDPFIPASSLPGRQDTGQHVHLWQPAQGGHVGFPAGRPPGHVRHMPQAVVQWLEYQLA
jgi:predicted alpha/beta-fold hydrolase